MRTLKDLRKAAQTLDRGGREKENLRLYGSKTRPNKRDPFKILDQNAKIADDTRSFIKKK